LKKGCRTHGRVRLSNVIAVQRRGSERNLGPRPTSTARWAAPTRNSAYLSTFSSKTSRLPNGSSRVTETEPKGCFQHLALGNGSPWLRGARGTP
jgi:hypothetical protein